MNAMLIPSRALTAPVSDDDGDWALSRAEFERMIAFHLPDLSFAPRTLNTWFRQLDKNGRGGIEVAEYFAFAVREALLRVELVFPDQDALPPAVERRLWAETLFGKALLLNLLDVE